MSNGGGIIIIRSVAAVSKVTDDERAELTAIEERYAEKHGCSPRDAWFICRLVWRLVRP